MGSGYAAYRAARTQEESLGPSLSEALVESFEQKMAEKEGRRMGLFKWSLRVPEPKTGTLDFERYPFQKELYSDLDDVRDVAIMKATQVGVSAYLVRWTMHSADVQGKTALYVFPKLVTMLNFSDARIRPLIIGSEHLRARVPATHVQNKGLKQIGLGFVNFRGSESKDGLESVDADRLALDEYDLLVQENIPIAEQRLSNSLDPRIRRVGWPSVPEWGMHEQWLSSDQREWQVKCTNTKGGCKEGWQPIDFFENVYAADQRPIGDQVLNVRRGDVPYVGCKTCTKPLDVAKGQWVAKYPDREKRGYHLPRQIVPHQDIAQMVKESKKRKPYEVTNFFNRWLGLPHVAEENRLSPAALAAAVREYAMQDGYVGNQLVTMGVDVASARDLSVRISLHTDDGTKGALWIGEVDKFDDLDGLMRRYGVNMCCIDSMPEMRSSRAFAEKFPGRVYLVRYAGPQAIKVLDVDEDMGVITVRRTEAIDAAFNMIRAQRNELPINRPEHYDRQMRSLVRFVERDEFDKVTIGYKKTGEADDFAHAEVYDMVATEAFFIRQAVDEAQREVFQPVDNFLDFQRQDLGSDEMDWSPGRDSDADYSPGFGESADELD